MTGAWLLDLTIGGRVMRYATQRVTVTDARGRSLLYRAGLADFEMRVDGLQESQGFEVVDPSVDWPLLAARGENLDRATCILRYWSPGQVLEAALMVLDGICSSPEYGDPNRVAGVFVGSVKAETADRLWPDPRAVVSLQTWEHTLAPVGPQYDDAIVGAPYPTVFGYPGEDDDGLRTAGTPALLVKNTGAAAGSYILVSDRVTHASDIAGSVRIMQPDTLDNQTIQAAVYEERDVVTTQDLLGRTVSVTEFEAGSSYPAQEDAGVAGAVTPVLGQRYYASWHRPSEGGGGGILAPDRDGPIRDLVDLALWVGRNSGRKFDHEAQEAQRGALSPYAVDGYIAELNMKLVPWFEAHIQPLFPIVRARTARGMYWRHVNWWAGPTDCIGHINADARQFHRVSPIRSFDDQIANHFTLDFAMNAANRKYQGRRTLSATAKDLPWFESADLVADDRIVGSPICARSQSVYGVREASPKQSPFVWSAGQAGEILSYWAARDAFPRRPVSYQGRPSEVASWTAGDAVMVTDHDRASLDEAVALVTAIRLSGSRLVEVDLQLLDRRVRAA